MLLCRFSNPDIPMEVSGSGMNKTSNTITMRSGLHSLFDNLDIWLEETAVINAYDVRMTDPILGAGTVQPTVTFTSIDVDRMPVPNPEFIRLHAICARVAHLSGAGQHFDAVLRWFQDVDSMRTLEGEDAIDYLCIKLDMFSVVPPV